MRSPFAVFRKHQRVLMVVTIGLALFAFVICSGPPDPASMPMPLMAVAIICICGGVAWVAGVPSKKSSETSVMGLIIGVALAFVMIRTSGPPDVVRLDSGGISRDEFSELRRNRELSNQFVSQAIFRTRDEADYQAALQQYQFGGFDFFANSNPTSERDIVTTELLRREAEALGLVVPDRAVTDYINELTDNGMTPDLFKELRQNLGIGEDRLFAILAAEIQARMAAEYLYDFDFENSSRMSTTLAPEQYWDFYRQIWVEQSAEVVAIPVEDFVDESAEPPLEDLQQLFAEYRGNYPNRTKYGLLDEGRFGFMQPRKVEVAFLEVVFDDVKETIAPATEEEVEAYYQENYVLPAEERAAAEAAAAEMESDAEPVLPELEFDRPDATDSPDPAPANSDSNADPPDSTDDTPAPADAPEPGAGTPSTPDSSNEEESDSTDSSAPPETSGIGIPAAFPEGTQFVALQQVPPESAAGEGDAPADDAPADDAPVDDAPADDAPADDAPASDNPDTPAAADPDSATAEPESGTEEGTEPAPPVSAVPPLTEALREQIRSEIVRERTLERMQEIAADAMQAFTDLAFNMSLPEDDDKHLTAEELSQQIASYAEENGLHYGTTPLLTFNDLQESEEFPVGSAFVEGRGTVAQTYSQSNPQDLYRADIAESLGTDSRFVFWKTADVPEDEPDSLEDEGVRAQVEEAWRLQQARASATNRANELLTLIQGSEGDLDEALAGQTTTGAADADALVVVPTGEFRWLSDPRAPRPDPFFSQPQLRDPNGVTGVGPEFMRTVFEELAPGEVGMAANVDHSELYLVKVLERTPWGDEEEEVFRQEFLAQPLFDEFSDFGFSFSSVYQRLAAAEALQYRHDWIEQLWEKHGAQLLVESS